MTDPFVAVDPGPAQSAWVLWSDGRPQEMAIEDNGIVLERLRLEGRILVIEWVESFGMAVGKDVFETVYRIGRFAEAAGGEIRVPRREVKMHLCGSARAKDSHIRQALIDRFGGTGGRQTAVGTKRDPGPLYQVKRDLWSAVAVAVTYEDRHG